MKRVLYAVLIIFLCFSMPVMFKCPAQTNTCALNVNDFHINTYLTSCVASTGALAVETSISDSTFYYSWSNFKSGDSIFNLPAASYTVTITSQSGCSATLTATVGTVPSPTTTKSVDNITCYGLSNGSIHITVQGGTGPYQYVWWPNTADTNTAALNLAPGNYDVTVSDDNGCTASVSGTVSQPTQLQYTGPFLDIVCVGELSGPNYYSAAGGTTPYTFSMPDSEYLPAGTNYTIVVTDANNCTVSGILTVFNDVPPLTAQITDSGQEYCIEATGGTGNYSYLWAGGSIDSCIMLTAPGSYSCTVTDNLGCTVSDTVKITTGLAALIAENIKISPNPVSDFLNLYIGDESLDIVQIIVTDMEGRRIYQTKPSGLTKTTIATGSWADGPYNLEIRTDKASLMSQFAVQHQQ